MRRLLQSISFTLAVFGVAFGSAFAAPLRGTRPNFLFIIVDDQSPFDLRIYDPRSTLDTPNIDRLAARGIVLDAAYHMGAWSGAVCTPSRHMIMSGRGVWHIPSRPGALLNPQTGDSSRVPPDLADHTLAAIFNRAGYDTMRTCKVENSYAAANRQFTVRREATRRGVTDETGSPWHAQQVLDYLDDRESRNDSDPFLIYLGFSHPHDPRDAMPHLLSKYGATNQVERLSPPPLSDTQPSLPINYLPEHPFPDGHPNLRDETQVEGVWDRRDEATIRNELGRHFACSELIDTQIGRVLDRLERQGELDNTYIVYTSDHGIAVGRHGLQGKQNLYEHTWRVPFIVVGRGIEPGTRAPGNIYLSDLLATLCDLAGIVPPSTNEGLSVRPVLEGRQPTIRDTLYGVYCGGTKPGIRAVRKGPWKLIEYDVMDGAVRRTQLFNLNENPWELLAEHQHPNVTALTGNQPDKHQINLADVPDHAATLAELRALLLAEMRRLDDPFRLWNQTDDDR